MVEVQVHALNVTDVTHCRSSILITRMAHIVSIKPNAIIVQLTENLKEDEHLVVVPKAPYTDPFVSFDIVYFHVYQL